MYVLATDFCVYAKAACVLGIDKTILFNPPNANENITHRKHPPSPDEGREKGRDPRILQKHIQML